MRRHPRERQTGVIKRKKEGVLKWDEVPFLPPREIESQKNNVAFSREKRTIPDQPKVRSAVVQKGVGGKNSLP